MDRTAYVARTAYDLTHVNHLRVPEFGVLKLFLSFGGKTSKSYLPDTAPPPKTPDTKATDDFHFAPEKEKPELNYTIDDKFGCITKATIELFRRDLQAAIWKKELKADEYTDGDHKFEYDAKIDKSTEFPEEIITVQHSPYKFKITLEGEGGHSDALYAWTYFHIMVHSFEFELGPKDVVKEAQDKALYDTLGGLPAENATTQVKLLSNIFSTGSDKADNTLFNQYKAKWTDGPNIPVFAKIFIGNAADGKEDIPKAVGKIRLLWDYTDPDESMASQFDKAKEFLELAIDYYKATTKPKGDNCHKDRGGKRGDAAKYIFPAQAGYAPADALTADTFPFKVVVGSTRKWSSYSETWPTGKLMGKTGVMFQPSRMAGDDYTITAYFPHYRKPDGTDNLDVEDDDKLKSAIKKSTGKFQLWREVHLISYRKKASTIPSIAIGTVQGYYAPAYMSVVDKSGAIGDMPDYDTKLRAKTNVLPQEKKLAVAAGDQGTITKSSIKFLSYDDWKNAYKAATGKDDTQMGTWLTGQGLETLQKYKTWLEAITDATIPKACDAYLSASDGINILQFDLYWEAGGGLRSGTNGFAATSFPSGSRSKAAYLQTRADYTGQGNNNMQQTTTHEIGHINFLPHAFDAGGYVNALHDEDAHWHNCTMSYNYNVERKFCGLCLLRLRGWDQTGLVSARASNKKP